MTSSYDFKLDERRAGAITLPARRFGDSMPPAKNAGGTQSPATHRASHNQGEQDAYWDTANTREPALSLVQ